MTVLYIDDFKAGLDVRKDVLSAAPGSLQELENCVITPGGEIEKARGWVEMYSVPANLTIGLHGTNSGTYGTEQLWVFALGTGAPVKLADMGPGIYGQQCALMQGHLNAVPGDEVTPGALMEWGGCREYGQGQFFVSAGVYTAGTGRTQAKIRNWWNTVNVPNYVGYHPLVSGQKVYRASNSVVYFSGVGDPSDTNPLNGAGTGPNVVHPGAGFIDTGKLNPDTNWLVGMAPYYKQTAVFSRKACLLFAMDPDPTKNELQQTLPTGAWSGFSIQPHGVGDVIFLTRAGVRSLRALTSGLQAGVSDVGAPLDPLIQAQVADGSAAGLYAPSTIDSVTGRYMLGIGNKLYILNTWPSSKISAWSVVTCPFTIDYLASAGTKIFARSGDKIFQWGGPAGTFYDNRPAIVRTPLHPAETTMTKKKALSVGALVRGSWAMDVCMDPDNPTTFEPAAILNRSTYAQETIPFSGFGSHIGFRFTTNDAAPNRLGGISVRFEKSTEL